MKQNICKPIKRRAPQNVKLRGFIKFLLFVTLFTIVATLFDNLFHESFHENALWFVLLKNLGIVLTYMIVMPKQSTFWHLLASASVFSWLSVALFMPALNPDWTFLKEMYFGQTINIGILCEKFFTFRLIEIILYW